LSHNNARIASVKSSKRGRNAYESGLEKIFKNFWIMDIFAAGPLGGDAMEK
jgi:hypothetical protein